MEAGAGFLGAKSPQGSPCGTSLSFKSMPSPQHGLCRDQPPLVPEGQAVETRSKTRSRLVRRQVSRGQGTVTRRVRQVEERGADSGQ